MAMFLDEAKDLVQFLGSVLSVHQPTHPHTPTPTSRTIRLLQTSSELGRCTSRGAGTQGRSS